MGKTIAAMSLAVLMLAGCATGYQDMSNPLAGMFGGYCFAGNAALDREKAGRFMLYRCAEVTQREGKKYFAMYGTVPDAIQDKRISERTNSVIGGAKPSLHVYILPLDQSSPGALSVDEVIQRLKPEVAPGSKS